MLLRSPDLSAHQSENLNPCLRRLYPKMSIKNVGNYYNALDMLNCISNNPFKVASKKGAKSQDLH